ncbi:MAG: ribose-phosphate diphosphokinase [Anaerolineae bacterium]
MSTNPRGRLLLASCRSGTYLANAIHKQLQANGHPDIPYLSNIDFQFADSEICVRLDEDVSGCDVFLMQSLHDGLAETSVSENYLAMCIAARTLREWGAHKVTAILPYLAYARQDKPTRLKREPTTAKLMADLSIMSGIDRLITWHPHYQQIHGFYGQIPVTVLEPFDLFTDIFDEFKGSDDTIIIAPDAGASRLVTYLGRDLELPVAIASKFHPNQGETEITQIIGDFANKSQALIFDDMMSSGGTVSQLVQKLAEDTNIDDMHLTISHNLCSDSAYHHLCQIHAEHGLRRVITMNTIPQTEAFQELAFFNVIDLSTILTRAIEDIHFSRM